ncbi:MAG: NifU family protein [Acidobacteria bacterium]|nr:NifU family protein [Acidobacteriota bacterium]
MALDTSTAESASETTVLTVTDIAVEKVLEIRADEDEPETLGLRIEVIGSSGGDYTYDLAFSALADAASDDDITVAGEISVMIPANSIEKLTGSTLDLPSAAGQGGLVIRNPNRPNPLGDLGDLDLTGDVADKVNQLLEASINPALASHDGSAALVGVDDGIVYVTMGGGCQGCSMSAATLSQGIKSAILEAVPEVRDVVDATDHSAGENPFYS